MIEPKPKLITPTLAWFLLAMVLANIASTMVFTVLALYLADLGASVGQVGFVFSAASLVPMALQIFGGWLSDSIGRLRTIAIGSGVAVLGYLGFALAPTWTVVLAALGLEYVSGSLVGPSYGAFIADQSSEVNRGKVFGLSNGIFLVVGVLGPPLAGWLVDRSGFRVMMWSAFWLYTGATGLRIWMAAADRFLPERPAEIPTWEHFRMRLGSVLALLAGGGILTWLLVTDGVSDIAARLSGELQPLYVAQVAGLNVLQIGWLHSILSILMMAVTPPSGWLSDHWGERAVIAAGFFLQFIGMAWFVLARSFPGFAGAAVLLGAGFGVLNPAYDSLVSKVVPERIRGLAFGFFRSSLGLFSLPAPWLGAQLWQRFDPRLPFGITGVGALAAVGLAWVKLRRPAQNQGEAG